MSNICSNELTIFAKPEVIKYIEKKYCPENEGGFHIPGNMTPDCAYRITDCIDGNGAPTGEMKFEVPYFGTRDLPPTKVYEEMLQDLKSTFPDQEEYIEMSGRYVEPGTGIGGEWADHNLYPFEDKKLDDLMREFGYDDEDDSDALTNLKDSKEELSP